MSKLEILEKAITRAKQLRFGDPITNVCASEDNPRRHAYFVEFEFKSIRNKYGVTHVGHLVKCTDRKGRFWRTDPTVIYPDHLDYEQAKKLSAAIFAAEYGSEQCQTS